MKTIERTVKSGAWEYLKEMLVDERVKVCHDLYLPIETAEMHEFELSG